MSTTTTALRTVREDGLSSLTRRGLAYLALRSPLTNAASRRLYWTVAPRFVRWHHSSALEQYAAPLEPFCVRWVDPADIVRFSRRPYPPDRNRRELFGTVRDGEWDRRSLMETPGSETGVPPRHLFDAETVTETPLYHAIEACIVGDDDWLETPFVRDVIGCLEAGEYPVWGTCRDRRDVIERCRDLETLAVDMICEGYRSQRELVTAGESDRDVVGTFAEEITVDVARDGELLAVGGKHRLCLAKAIGLERIPVSILVRHRDWVERCEQEWFESDGQFREEAV
ncbi:hypothetical protein OB955_18195 [Halobacteria archaeon AArc-m2/3/4]|uniref:ParB-like nuclease domain-containing protein n=1 Tax=Natronoglomus mannanivorans TaxID=2979990 RepID=A0AAP2Z5E2_9EURY|nr:hypothetical protein [Halobacteria archaeon AArc-xg1-1]MCU4974654.1 hypothetical protein [Halobacteria archaeon AArc-m2/3/4]